jgi:hypothetical protein
MLEALPFIAVSLILLLLLGVIVGGLAVWHRNSKGRKIPDLDRDEE